LGTRNGKQIRDRFINVLDPEIKKGKFTEDEDRKLILLFKQYGPKWATIAKFYPNRTADMVKNRFHSSIKKKLLLDINDKSFTQECKDELMMIASICKQDTAENSNTSLINLSSKSFVSNSQVSSPLRSDFDNMESRNFNSTHSSKVSDCDFYSSQNFNYDVVSCDRDIKVDENHLYNNLNSYHNYNIYNNFNQFNNFLCSNNNPGSYNWNFEEYFTI